MIEIIDINSLTQIQYDSLYKSVARALHTLRKFITIESITRHENGKTVLKVKRKGFYYPYVLTMRDGSFMQVAVQI